ncbi:MAG: hypothetical protein IT337_16480 [Thermomicrobiales bacterium]|nr:hypothetical protein [Thermomicrobiales bacterium]
MVAMVAALTVAIGGPAASEVGVQNAAAAAPCAIPAAVVAPVAATPLPVSDATPVATSAADMESAALTAELDTVARALAACLSQGKAGTVVELATARYLGQLYASDLPLSPEEYLQIAPQLGPVETRIVSVTDGRRLGPGRVSAEVVSVVGRQLLRSRWDFEKAPAGERTPNQSTWRVDREQALPLIPPADADLLSVTLQDYAIAIDPTTTSGPDVVLRGENLAAQDHEMLVLRFAAGFTTEDLLRAAGPALPKQTTYVGQATVPAGGRADLVLTGLEPGRYTVVCLFPAEDGTPHLALGMATTFEVER